MSGGGVIRTRRAGAVPLILALVTLCGLLASCQKTRPDAAVADPSGQTEKAPDLPAGQPEGVEDGQDGGDSDAGEIYSWLKDVAEVPENTPEGDALLHTFAEKLAEIGENFSGDLSVMDYYSRVQLVFRYDPDERAYLDMIYPFTPEIDLCLEMADRLYLDGGGAVQIGASGPIETERGGAVADTGNALIYYRGTHINCPYELDWCGPDGTEHWGKELLFYDCETAQASVVLPLDPMKGYYDFTLESEEGRRYCIKYVEALPHSDQGWTVKGCYDADTNEFTETGRVGNGI